MVFSESSHEHRESGEQILQLTRDFISAIKPFTRGEVVNALASLSPDEVRILKEIAKHADTFKF